MHIFFDPKIPLLESYSTYISPETHIREVFPALFVIAESWEQLVRGLIQ